MCVSRDSSSLSAHVDRQYTWPQLTAISDEINVVDDGTNLKQARPVYLKILLSFTFTISSLFDSSEYSSHWILLLTARQLISERSCPPSAAMGIFSMFDYSFTPPSNLDSMATLPVPSEDSQPRSEFTDFNHQHESPSIHPKSPPALPQDRVPTELLVMIFNHLLQPIPLPLSKPPRSSLRQPDLISVMRTCKVGHLL